MEVPSADFGGVSGAGASTSSGSRSSAAKNTGSARGMDLVDEISIFIRRTKKTNLPHEKVTPIITPFAASVRTSCMASCHIVADASGYAGVS